MIDSGVNARMHSQGQPEPAGLDRIEQAIKLGCLVTNDMENRTEYLAVQIAHSGNFENVRRNIEPVGWRARRYVAREVDNRRASHQRDMCIEAFLGGAIDGRAD